jgi:hypothetical protein
MRRFQAIFAVLTAAAAVLAGGIPASASTGSNVITPEHAGYLANGNQFKQVQANVFLRQPAQYANYLDLGWYEYSLELWSSHDVVILALDDGVIGPSGQAYRANFVLYDRPSRTAVATLYQGGTRVTYCAPDTGCGSLAGRGAPYFPYGDTGSMSLRYSPSTGNVTFSLTDTSGYSLTGSLFAGLGESFKGARIGTEFNLNNPGPQPYSYSYPWSSPPSWIQPPSSMKIASFSSVALTTYSGHKGTLSSSSWTTSKLLSQMDTGTPLSMASPTGLTAGGSAFQVSLTGAG